MASSPSISLAPHDHDVLFYERDEDLVTTVSSFLGQAVRDGDVAILVATPAHRTAIERTMEAAGIDVEQTQRCGYFISLDAAATLARFSVDGTHDPEAFDDVIGGLVRESRFAGRNVRAYGEMVALLWDAGNAIAAMELEELWNDLRTREPFALLCGYPTHSLTGDDTSSAVLGVCQLHSEFAEWSAPDNDTKIVQRAARRFDVDDEAPRNARHFVRATLDQWERSEFSSEASLAVTELVTNAVCHVGSDVTVTLTAVNGALRLGVTDDSTRAPVQRVAGTHDVSGRGLPMIAAIAQAWGTEVGTDRKTVWVELTAEPIV